MGEDEERPERARSWAQTGVVVAAILGILGSVGTVLIGDVLDRRDRDALTRQNSYTDFARTVFTYETETIEATEDSLAQYLTSLERYREDPDDDIRSVELDTNRDLAREQLTSLDSTILGLYEPLNGVRLNGSTEGIGAANTLFNTAVIRREYLLVVFSAAENAEELDSREFDSSVEARVLERFGNYAANPDILPESDCPDEVLSALSSEADRDAIDTLDLQEPSLTSGSCLFRAYEQFFDVIDQETAQR